MQLQPFLFGIYFAVLFKKLNIIMIRPIFLLVVVIFFTSGIYGQSLSFANTSNQLRFELYSSSFQDSIGVHRTKMCGALKGGLICMGAGLVSFMIGRQM